MSSQFLGFIILTGVIAVVSFRLGAASDSRRKPPVPLRAASWQSQERSKRLARVKQMGMDEARLRGVLQRYRTYTREGLVHAGYLKPGVPGQGKGLLRDHHRTESGNALLEEAKDVLFALLFGDENTNCTLERVERELLTLTAPKAKAQVLGFLQASTEVAGSGKWQDPEDTANDEHAENILIEVEYGEVSAELVGDGIAVALRLINLLEVNEQVLYGRMVNVEQSTL